MVLSGREAGLTLPSPWMCLERRDHNAGNPQWQTRCRQQWPQFTRNTSLYFSVMILPKSWGNHKYRMRESAWGGRTPERKLILHQLWERTMRPGLALMKVKKPVLSTNAVAECPKPLTAQRKELYSTGEYTASGNPWASRKEGSVSSDHL